jgi:hypothetical protein
VNITLRQRLLLLTLLNIEKQTLSFNIKARVDLKTCRRARMSVWEAIELLNTLVDESGPDVSGSLNGILTI